MGCMTDAQAQEAYGRFLAGDEDALVSLVDAHKEGLIAFIQTIVGSYDVAQDLAIDVFAALIANRKPFRGDSAFQTYLFAIGKHLAFRHIRRYGTQSSLSWDDVIEEPQATTLEDAVVAADDRRRVRAALRDLKEEQRCVLYLLFFEGLSQQSVGTVMGKSHGQVHGLVDRAKRALRERLEGEGFGYAQV